MTTSSLLRMARGPDLVNITVIFDISNLLTSVGLSATRGLGIVSQFKQSCADWRVL